MDREQRLIHLIHFMIPPIVQRNSKKKKKGIVAINLNFYVVNEWENHDSLGRKKIRRLTYSRLGLGEYENAERENTTRKERSLPD